MKIAIHHRPGSFSDRWIAYCEKKSIPYKLVNAFDSDIVEQLSDCDAFMWHHHHAMYKDIIAAKKILFALEHAGIKVFPDFKTGWHFDDKVAQKYLLEAIGAPLVPSYVFYDKQEALAWAKSTSYPKVFKLKGGAGAAIVRLVRWRKDAKKLIKRSFSKGFAPYNRMLDLRERIRKFREGKESVSYVLKGVVRLFVVQEYIKKQARENGYIYFQDFMPDNKFDIRVVVVDSKAFAIKRMVRKNDFRASGSGTIIYNKSDIDINCVRLAFEINKKLSSKSVAYDFVYDKDGSPLVVEI